MKPKTNMAELLARARLAREAKIQEDTDRAKGDMQYAIPEPIPFLPDPPATLSMGERLAALRKSREEKIQEKIPSVPSVLKPIVTGMHGEAITYNTQQEEFIKLISSGASCVLIGAAGTGKTTSTQGGIQALIQTGKVPILQNDGHAHLTPGSPGILIVAFTRRAVNNIRKVQPTDLKSNCLTIHKLLEYAPDYYEVYDPETGDSRTTMRFIPTRNESNPLPSSIHTIVWEEGSMVGTPLHQQVIDALPHEVQHVYIGDIQQLPPVFGPAILGFKMNELPLVELTEVYRQALESPIIRLAHRILSGKPIPVEEFPEWKEEGKLTLHPWKKKLHPETALQTLAAFFTQAVSKGVYDPDEDMILIPFNKACGTIEINKHIANFLARQRDALTYEVIAGFNKHYFSELDKILYDREDAEIVSINPNPAYTGAKYQPCSRTLDYWGYNPNIAEEATFGQYEQGDDVDFLLEQVAASDDRVAQASHKVVIRLSDTGAEITLTKAAELNGLLHAYALTVHKSQGSEWRKVFFCLHQSHATMIQRELMYTAVTRAKEELYVICEPESFTKGIKSQRIKGDTIQEKAEFFKGKQQPTKGDK
jgi:exodeoxyribonuclease V alpha subunit